MNHSNSTKDNILFVYTLTCFISSLYNFTNETNITIFWDNLDLQQFFTAFIK